ncbi:SIR2 family protein [Candidatus Poriferisodalis sp.]|uniref:SIR2 family protein n=1 Tax=Candidatus Poriferisodalis sp. TaxID=3101277 RepID=UPI003B01DF68
MTGSYSGLRRFFEHQSTRDALAFLARQERIALVVGAGVSRESGLPGWTDLLENLLGEVALSSEPFRNHEPGLSGNDFTTSVARAAIEPHTASFKRLVMATHGLLGAASIVKSHFPEDDYLRRLKEALYQPAKESRLDITPGATAREIAALWTERGPGRLTVITTNYDLLIELALLDADVAASEVEIVSGAPDRDEADVERYRVIHLHGVIPHPNQPTALSVPSGDIVLAEDDYFGALDSAPATATRLYCQSLLERVSSLFVGTSLTDPNLLSYLHGTTGRTSSDVRHYVLGIGQGDQPPGANATELALAASRSAAAGRLSHMGAESLAADFFCQTSLFLRELRRTETEEVPLVEVLEQWFRLAVRIGVLPGPAFAARRSPTRLALSAAARTISKNFADTGALRQVNETLSLHLWVHDPTTDELVLVARSDLEFHDENMLERHPVEMPFHRLVVEAVCSGAPLEADGPALASSKWGSMLVVPINVELRELAHSAVPAGAIVLASDLADDAGLTRLRGTPAERAYLLTTLAQLGIRLLTGSREPS